MLNSTTNKFSEYYAEILRAEGLNSFASIDIADVSAPTLANYTTVVVGDLALTGGQVTMLSNWVNDGGHLFAMRPDKQLATLAGLVDESATLADGYLLIDTQTTPPATVSLARHCSTMVLLTATRSQAILAP